MGQVDGQITSLAKVQADGLSLVGGLAAAVDMLGKPAFVVDSRGKLLHCSKSSLALFQTVFLITNGRVLIRGRSEANWLRSDLEPVATNERRDLSGGHVLVLPRIDRRPLVLRIVYIDVLSTDGSVEVAALITSTDLEILRLPSLPLLQKVFGLTSVEARLVRALVETGNLTEASARTGISHETGRSYLKSIFSKVGCRSQVELAMLIQNILE